MIMRYQRVIPDSLPLSNGRRTNSTPSWKTNKEDEERAESNGHITTKTSSNFEGKGPTRFRSPSKASLDHHIGNGNGSAIGGDEAEVPNSPPTASNSRNHQNLDSNGVVGGGGNDNTFLQWGHRKRSRCSRGVALTDDTSSSTSTIQSTKLQRRLMPPHPSSSPNSNANTMPPPSLPSSNGISRGSNHKTPPKSTSSSPSPVIRRNLEERSGVVGNKSPPSSSGGGGSRAVASRSRGGKRSPSLDKKTPCPSSASARDEKMNACSTVAQQQEQSQEVAAAVVGDMNHIIVSPPHQAGGCSTNDDSNHDNTNAVRTAKIAAGGTAGGGGEKWNNGGGSEMNEWPRIYISLSRKEKEEDFLAMKGTKLPHRPKKRPKTIDRLLQYCFPGMWLSDLTRGRYEVREKKCPRKQKRRGLKGMESLESDSE